MLAEYSVSDAVATYYLYIKHIHDFIFALCTIIPMTPDEVLRKGSGTLCENLLMADAFVRNIIFPNKQKQKFENFYQGHLIESETYIGGTVECLNSGIYRCDLETDFNLNPDAYQHLINDLDNTLEFICRVEMGKDINDCTNLEECKKEFIVELEKIRDLAKQPTYNTKPVIYHLDVAAMYPNIILTNRLQPVAIVDERICSGCIFNEVENQCKRSMEWQWRADYYPLVRSEYEYIKQ